MEARSCSRRRPGPSSETSLPDGASVVDLGQQDLKDVQHERIFQLTLDGGPESFPPLKTEAPKSAPDALAERIERHVEEMIEQSFQGGASKAERSEAGGALKWTALGLGNIVLVVLTILVIIWLVRNIL